MPGTRRGSAKDGGHIWDAHRLAVLLVVAIALAAGALFGLAWVAGFHGVLVALAHPRWVWIAAAIGAEALAYLSYTVAYRWFVGAERGARFEVSKAAAIVTTGFSVFVHGGGFALDREALRRSGLSEDEARRRVLGLGVLEYAVLAPAAAIAALLVFLGQDRVSGSLTLPWVIGVPVGAALALTALHFAARVRRWPVIGGPLGHFLDALGFVLRLFRSPFRNAPAFLGMLGYWTADIFCLWAALHAFYVHPPPLAQLIVGYATGYAVTRRTLPLGGAGVVEALLPFALGWVAISLAPAVLAVFVYRLLNLWLPMIPALAGIPTIRKLERSRVRGGRRRRARHA
jgi:uncharacterized membrane protein YbhN (UPF0104 family)